MKETSEAQKNPEIVVTLACAVGREELFQKSVGVMPSEEEGRIVRE